MDKNIDMQALADQTPGVYERHAARFDAERAKVGFERHWLKSFANYLPAQGTILDVGCGAGEPIAQYFIQRHYVLTGIDYTESMIALAQARFPDQEWRVADMRTLDLSRTFDGIIAWHSFFHLRPEEQRQTLRRFASHLRPGGVLMITVGPK